MIEEGPYKVFGGNHIIFIYVCKSKSNVGQKLLPKELEQKIKGVLGWYFAKMQISGHQFFKIMTDPSYFETPPTLEFYEKVKSDFYECIKTIDEQLVTNPYMCGPQLTLGDVLVFNELSQFLAINGISIRSVEMKEYQNLVKWYTMKMDTYPAIKRLDE